MFSPARTFSSGLRIGMVWSSYFFSSMPQSGQAGFLNTTPTFGQQALQYSFWHRGHCHAVGLRNVPISRPHLAQNPRGVWFHLC